MEGYGLPLLPLAPPPIAATLIKYSEMSVEGQNEAKFLVQENNAMEKIKLQL